MRRWNTTIETATSALLHRSTRTYQRIVIPCVLCILGLVGCSSKSGLPPLPPPVKATMRILVVQDAELAEAIRQEWSSVSEEPIEIVESTLAQALAAKRLNADVVFYPSAMLGHLAEAGLLRPLDTGHIDKEDGEPADLLPTLRNHELTWNGKLFALPLGSPTLSLVYRSDIFDKLKLDVPRTWPEYHNVVARLAEYVKSQPAGKVVATVEARKGRAAAHLLLARAASYARREGSFAGAFHFRSFRPLINQPPFVRALKELAAVATIAPGGEKHDFQSARQALENGRALMSLTWPTRGGSSGGGDRSVVRGFTQLPGSKEHFRFETDSWRTDTQVRHVPLLEIAGRLGSLTADARRPRQATETLTWITGKRLGAAIGARSQATTLFRRSQLAAAGRWVGARVSAAEANQYATVVSHVSQQNVVMHSLRLPGRGEYLDELSKAVELTLAGKLPAQEALDEVARRWEEISKRRGRDAQLQAYRRSYGG